MIQHEQNASMSALLASATVLITAEHSPVAEQLGLLLRRSGLKAICVVSPADLQSHVLSLVPSAPPSLLVSLGFDSEKEQDLQQLDRWCSAASLTWLRAHFDEKIGRADVGPIFPTCCYSCFAALHQPRQPASVGQRPRAVDAHISFWLAAVAVRAIGYLVGDKRNVPETLSRFSLPDWQSRKLYTPCLINCGRKTSHTFINNERDPISCNEAVLFEHYLALSSRESLRDESTSLDQRQSLTLKRSIRFANSTMLPLTSSGVHLRGDVHALLCNADPPDKLPISKNHLGLLLQMSAGIRKREVHHPRPRRWAASAGNLASVELFLLTRNVPDLAPGLYYYQAAGHQLVHLQWRRSAPDVQKLFDELLSADEDADAAVLFTSSFERLRRKYSYFGYKLSLLDAGVAASQFQIVARALGVHSKFAPSWPDDRIADLCRLTEGEEHVTGLITLSRTSNTSHGDYVPALRQSVASRSLLTTFSDLTLGGLYSLLYQSSRIPSSEFSIRKKDRTPGCVLRPGIPRVSYKTRDLPATLFHRKSTRTFSMEPIDIERLSAVIYTSAASDIFEETEGVSPHVFLYLAAKRINGLDPAVYKVNFSSHTLERIGSLPSRSDEIKVFRGEDYTSAAAFLWLAGNVEAACDLENSFGYRKLLIRAGAFANRLLLSAIASHLEGALIAGVDNGQHSSSFGIATAGEVSLIAVLLGKAPHDD